MKKLKKPLIFTLVLLPVTVVAVVFTCLYQFSLYPPEVMETAVAQVGSEAAVIAVSVAQSTLTILVLAFFGYILADKTGLIKPFKLKSKVLIVALTAGAFIGAVLIADHFIFGAALPEIKEANIAGLSFNGVLAAVLYGGIIEEVMLRLFFMSLIAFLIWKIFCRKLSEENIPDAVFIVANVISALAFAAGHLPATAVTFGTLTPLIIFRCFLLNGLAGFLFGELYRRYGLGYAMIAHALAHIVCRLVLIIFV